jgi:hypothetical protein
MQACLSYPLGITLERALAVNMVAKINLGTIDGNRGREMVIGGVN